MMYDMYADMYSERSQPSVKLFRKSEKKLRDKGLFNKTRISKKTLLSKAAKMKLMF